MIWLLQSCFKTKFLAVHQVHWSVCTLHHVCSNYQNGYIAVSTDLLVWMYLLVHTCYINKPWRYYYCIWRILSNALHLFSKAQSFFYWKQLVIGSESTIQTKYILKGCGQGWPLYTTKFHFTLIWNMLFVQCLIAFNIGIKLFFPGVIHLQEYYANCKMSCKIYM